MASVDNRVVSVKFDNADFQNKIGPTLKGLDDLKKGLDLTESSKNLEGLSQAGKNFNLDGIGSAVESISGKFSAMGAIAFSVINNIVTRAIDAGSRLVSAFAIAPISDGFKEFETNANSIQTILANTADKGTKLNDVTAALDNLNEYADKTIYNFSEMARNIGTFTAAGVNLEDSKNSIKGIANLAAMAGSNSQQAAGAMYQLSQAMSAGAVHAQDWISVVNAGFAGPLQKQLFEAAKALGKLPGVPLNQTFDEWTKHGGNFKQAMEDGVFTSDVLKLSLKAMSGEMSKSQLVAAGYSSQQADYVLSTAKIAEKAATEVKTFTQMVSTLKEAVGTGWAESFKLIIGNFEEAKGLFTSLNDVFSGLVQNSSKQRNEMLNAWRDSGGRDAAIQALRNILWSLLTVVDAVKKAWRDVFPQMTGTRLSELTKNFENFTQKLIPTPEALEKIRDILGGFFSLISGAESILSRTASVLKNFWQALNFPKDIAGFIVDFLGKFGDKSRSLTAAIKEGSWDLILNERLQALAKLINGINIVPYLEKLKNVFETVKEAISKFFDVDKGAAASKAMDSIGESSKKLSERWDQLVAVGEKLSVFWERIRLELDKLKVVAQEVFDRIKESFSKTDFSNVWDGVNVGLAAGFLVMMKKLTDTLKDGVKLDFGKNGLINTITGSFDQLTNTLKSMQEKVKAEIIQKIAIALAILTASVFVLAQIDSIALTKSMTALGIGMGELVGSLAVLNKVISSPKDAARLLALTTTITIFAGALLVFAGAAKLLGSMSNDELARGLSGIAGLLIEVGLAVKFMPNNLELIATAGGIFALGIALISMSVAVKILSTLSWEEMIRGLTGLGGLLAEMAITLTLLPADLPLIGAGLLLVAGAMVVMAFAVKLFADMDFDKMIAGLTGMSAALIAILTTMTFMPADMPLIGAGLLLVAGAMVVMALSVKLLGDMDTEAMLRGLVAVAGLLAILAISLNTLEGALPGAAAMIVAAGAMVVMAIALKMLGELSWQQILVGLGALVAVLVVLGLASVLLSETIPFLLALGAALISIAAGVALFGLAVLGIGAGVYLFVQAIKTLMEIGPEGVTKILEVIPKIAEGLAKALGAFTVALLEQVPAILEALGKILVQVIQFLIDHMPQIVEFITKLVQAILQILRDNVPGLIQTGLELLMAFLGAIRDNIFQVTALVAEIIYNFLQALNAYVPYLIDAGMNLLVTLINGVANNLWMVFDAAGNLIGEFIRGLGSVLQDVVNAGGDVIINLITGFGKKAEDIVSAGTDALISFTKGLTGNALKLADAAFTVVTDFLNGLADVIDKRAPEIRAAGWNLARAIIDGLTGGLASMAGEVIDKFKQMATDGFQMIKDIFHIASPSKKMYELGVYIAMGLANALDDDTRVSTSAEEFGKNAYNKLANAFNTTVDLSQLIENTDPTIKPVLDLTDVKRGMKDLNSTIGTPTIDTTVSLSQAASLAAATKAQDSANTDTSAQQTPPTAKEIKFEQNIYSPTELSMNDIYRQTRSQIAFAKEHFEELTHEHN